MPWPAFQYEGQSFRKCPRYMINAQAEELVRIYSHYKNGFLLKAGGIMDQPALYKEVMEIIEHTVNELDDD